MPLMNINNIEVLYEGVILVLKGISLTVPEESIISLLGANGAGKSTVLKAISNILRTERGDITKGTIEFDGIRIDRMHPFEVVKKGIILVMDGRHIFEHLTVEDDLLSGAYIHRYDKSGTKRNLDMIYNYFPSLYDRRNIKTGYISGGEQQMVVIGRALMARPKLILLDEPSMGLAPMLARQIFSILDQLNRMKRIAMLLAEQNARIALEIAHYGYVMEDGRIVLDGTSQTLQDNKDIKEFYLGLSDIGNKSYRDVKHYRRRKRWLS